MKILYLELNFLVKEVLKRAGQVREKFTNFSNDP